MALNFAKAEFVRAATKPADFLRDGLPQFVFAGRSNVGKSSVINRLVRASRPVPRYWYNLQEIS